MRLQHNAGLPRAATNVATSMPCQHSSSTLAHTYIQTLERRARTQYKRQPVAADTTTCHKENTTPHSPARREPPSVQSSSLRAYQPPANHIHAYTHARTCNAGRTMQSRRRTNLPCFPCSAHGAQCEPSSLASCFMRRFFGAQTQLCMALGISVHECCCCCC